MVEYERIVKYGIAVIFQPSNELVLYMNRAYCIQCSSVDRQDLYRAMKSGLHPNKVKSILKEHGLDTNIKSNLDIKLIDRKAFLCALELGESLKMVNVGKYVVFMIQPKNDFSSMGLFYVLDVIDSKYYIIGEQTDIGVTYELQYAVTLINDPQMEDIEYIKKSDIRELYDAAHKTVCEILDSTLGNI